MSIQDILLKRHLEVSSLKNKKLNKFSLDSFQSLENGEIPQWFLDVVVQNQIHEGLHTLWQVDYLIVGQIITQLGKGNIALIRIPIRQRPLKDSSSKNNNILKELPHPFTGEFFIKKGIEDGYIEWTKPISSQIQTDDGISPISILPNMVPLEVGYQSSSKTFSQINRNLGIARWPYYSNYITLLWKL